LRVAVGIKENVNEDAARDSVTHSQTIGFSVNQTESLEVSSLGSAGKVVESLEITIIGRWGWLLLDWDRAVEPVREEAQDFAKNSVEARDIWESEWDTAIVPSRR